jgi:adenylosuccinate lyase
VLDKLGLKPDYTATQIVQKERLADCGHGLITLMHVLGDFSNDIRMLYSSAIGEVTSRDNKERLGGSSADAMKNNPINYENMCGKVVVVESGMRVLYEMIHSDFQRDLRNSVMARYQPQAMMAETYESFSRLNKALPQLSINEDRMAQNLEPVRKNPSEAMIAILRGAGWIHPKYGVGHDFVKEMGKKAQREKRPLMAVCMDDPEFKQFYDAVLDPTRRDILDGKLEKYTGSSAARVMHNINYAKEIIRQR